MPIFDTYIAVVRNSVGSKLFRNFYANVNGRKTDVMRNGELSCAFHVSSILALFGLIKRIHGTVDSTVKNLKRFGWKPIARPKIGSVLVWEEKDFGKGDVHKHLGFFIGAKRAISNSRKVRSPIEHSWNFDGKRRITMILWNPNIQ